MRIKLEKLNKSSEKKTPEVSPKAVIDEVNKKTPRKNTNRVQAYGYQRPMGKLVSEKGPSEAKPRRSRKKVEKEPTVSSVPLDMIPVDERTDLDHTKKSLVKPYWKTPENIPVEPEVFEFTEPERDIYAEGNEYPTPDEEREQLEMIDQHNLETFGTTDKSKIGMILAEKYNNDEADLETLPPNLDFPMDNFDEYNRQIQKVSLQRDEQIHGNPNSYEFRKPRREKNRGHDYGNGAREGQRQGFFDKIKNLWLELKADTKSIAEELGWDEEVELEKQRKQYFEGLKRESTNPPHGTVDGKFGPMTKASEQDHEPSA